MKIHFIDEPTPYTGDELSNHWIYKNFGILGDAVVSFVGPCDVSQGRMVDLEDVLNDDFIYSTQMLHFIVEMFGLTLQDGVLLQRLFSSMIHDKINTELNRYAIKRRGDDLFYQDRQKLSVSICTVSPTSILIHTGLNVEAVGAPVEAAGLTSELGIQGIKSLAMSCMRTLADEWEDIKRCCCKVRAVH